MAIRPIRLFGDPILRKPAIEVVEFDAELRQLVTDLTDTIASPGVHTTRRTLQREHQAVPLADGQRENRLARRRGPRCFDRTRCRRRCAVAQLPVSVQAPTPHLVRAAATLYRDQNVGASRVALGSFREEQRCATSEYR